MHCKKLLLSVAISITLILPFSAFAAPSQTTENISKSFLDYSKLNDQQKSDVKEYTEKLAVVKKEFINKMVNNGSITKEQGEQLIKKVDDTFRNYSKKGIIPGFRNNHNFNKSKNTNGKHCYKINFDLSTLTNEQKTEIIHLIKKIGDIEKERLNLLTNYNLLEKDKANEFIKKIDATQAAITAGDLESTAKFFTGFSHKEIHKLHKIDTSKLTEDQKKALKNISTKMNNARKELKEKLKVNKQ